MIHLLVDMQDPEAANRRPHSPAAPQSLTGHTQSQVEAGDYLLHSPALVPPTTTAAASSLLRRTRASKACTNCARIKCKCIPRAGGGDGCERCHRLSKKCEPSISVATPSTRRARVATATPRTKTLNSRSARLEARLNDLVDLLRTSQTISALPTEGGNNNSNSSSAAIAADTVPENVDDQLSDASAGDDDGDADADGDDDDDDDDDDDNDNGDGDGVNDTSPQSAATTGITSTAPPTLPDGGGADDEAEELLPFESEACLRRFSEDMLPLAPFIYLPPDETVRHVRQEYPFLWRCIKAAACIHPAHRIRAAAAARRAIIRQVIENGERSLDILLGMLTFVSWVHLTTKDRSHRNFSSVVAQMAICVVWDLGLTMPPLLDPTAGDRFVPVVQIPGIPASLWKAQRSMEERRAVLGVYLVTSATSQMFRSADGLRWSPYLDSCLTHIVQHSSIAQDATLVQHVKMQLLVNQVRYASCTSHASSSMYRSFGSGPANIPAPYMDSLRAQLDEIVGVVDGNSPAFDNFTTHNLYHFAILAIHETALARSNRLPPTLTAASVEAQQPQRQQRQQQQQQHQQHQGSHYDQAGWMVPEMQRFEHYQRCLTSVKAWFDRLFAWPLQFYVCLPSGTYLQMFYVIVCLHKLTTIHDPAWNVDAVRSVMDLFPTIDRIIDMCEQLRAMMAAQMEEGVGPQRSGGGGGGGDYNGRNDKNKLVNSVMDQDEHDPILVAIRKFSTLRVIWQNEMAARTREQALANAAAATAAAEAPPASTQSYGSNIIDNDLGTAGTAGPSGDPLLLEDEDMVPLPIDFFSNYSLDVLSYFHAMPDLMTDVSWS